MKTTASVLVLALTMSAVPALAQSNSSTNGSPNSPNVSAPSAQNSGAGIQGYPGNKNGPAAHPGTVGSATGNQDNSTVQQQDTSKIQGLPGNKSGPPAKRQ